MKAQRSESRQHMEEITWSQAHQLDWMPSIFASSVQQMQGSLAIGLFFGLFCMETAYTYCNIYIKFRGSGSIKLDNTHKQNGSL